MDLDTDEGDSKNLPKTKERYDMAYSLFMDWFKKKKHDEITEDVLIEYFKELSHDKKPSTLWFRHSSLKTRLLTNNGVQLKRFHKLKAYLKHLNDGYKMKKSDVFSADEIKRFIDEAPDNEYLFTKVILILGICGGCRRSELRNLSIDHIVDNKNELIVKIVDSNTKIDRMFAITGKYYDIVKEYMALRPPLVKPFFLLYRDGKCSHQPSGINRIGKQSQIIAEYLNLPNPEDYTGHCFRRSGASILADSKLSTVMAKNYTSWKSTALIDGLEPMPTSSVESDVQNQNALAKVEKKDLIVGNRIIGDSHPCFVIAEIGQNHQGDIDLAKKLIDEAKRSGAHCVKFQKSCLEEKFTRKSLDSEYLSKNSWGKTYGEHKEFLEFSKEQYLELKSYAEQKDILFTASAMDPESLRFLIKMGVPFIKIGSGDSDNIALINEAAQSGIPLIISTGMQDYEGVKMIYSTVSQYHDDFALLHCVSSYPTPIREANLKAVTTLKEFPVQIGYSGHEIGYNLTLAAVTLGAKIVERHITMDKNMKGSDHKCSLEPHEFEQLIRAIREIEIGMGDGVKRIMDCERPCIEKLGKCIVFSKNLRAGSSITECDIKVKVAQGGLRPRYFFDLVGKIIKEDGLADEPFTLNHLPKFDELNASDDYDKEKLT